MIEYTLPPTRKKPTQQVDIYNVDEYNTKDPIPHHDDEDTTQEYKYKGHQGSVVCYTDIDLAGQQETRQSTSGYLLFFNGALIHYHGRTERLIITSTCAVEYIALSRGHAACRFITTILQFYGNQANTYYLLTDNQAAEHLATQPNLNEPGRSIDIRHHEVRQDYLEGKVHIGGVKTTENPSDILTKFLPAPAHQEHSKYLNLTPTKTYTQNGNFIRQNNNTHLTSAKRYGQRRIHKLRQVHIRLNHQKGKANKHIRKESLSPVHYMTKKQRQRQRQRFWNAIHILRQQHPHLEIKAKRTLTKSRSPPHRHDAQYIQAPCCPPHPLRIKHTTPPQPTPINPNNSRILHTNRQHPHLQARHTQNPLHQEPIRRSRAPDHDLHTTKQITNRQKKRQTHQKSTKILFLKHKQRHHHQRSHPLPSSNPYHKPAQMFSYPNKTLADFVQHTNRTRIPQCHTPITQWNPPTHHATPPKPRPRPSRPSPDTASTHTTTHLTQKPIRVDTPRKYNVKNKMTAGENSHNFSENKEKHWRSKTVYSQHKDETNQYPCQPQFNQQHPAPIPITRFQRPSHRAPR
jgi:hypothetical protein